MKSKVSDVYSEKTRLILEKAGWFPGRRIDIEKYCDLLRRGGGEPADEVKEFLSEFGGLRLEMSLESLSSRPDWCVFEVREPLFEWMEFYSTAVGEKLFQIGLAYRGYMALGMGSSGAVYAGFDETLVKVGGTGIEAIECLCHRSKCEEVKIDT